MELGLDGKVCVVTGASRGIGLEVGRSLCSEGAQVLFVGRDADALVEAAEGCGGEYLAGDITEPELAERIVATCAEQMGGIDVLVNNAGIIQVGPLDHMTIDDFEEAMATHFWGPLFTILSALPYMRGRGARRIVIKPPNPHCETFSAPGGFPSLTGVVSDATIDSCCNFVCVRFCTGISRHDFRPRH